MIIIITEKKHYSSWYMYFRACVRLYMCVYIYIYILCILGAAGAPCSPGGGGRPSPVVLAHQQGVQCLLAYTQHVRLLREPLAGQR